MRFAWDEAEALMQATARVEREAGGAWGWRGTAFFVDDRTLLTCAHVVAAEESLRVVWFDSQGRHEVPVTVRSRHPDVVGVDPYPTPDVAVLDVSAGAEVPRHHTTWLDEAPVGEHLIAFGFTDEYSTKAAFGHPARFTKVGLGHSDDDGGVVWSLNADRVRGGMSGAPVLDLATGRVVAILKRTRDSVKDLGGFATGMDVVLDTLPEIRAANEAANPQGRQLAVAAELWGGLLQQAAAPLEDSAIARSVVAEELGLSEQELIGDDAAQARRLARELFVADLGVLVRCMTRLKNVESADVARKVFEAVALCALHDGEPWVAPSVALELEQQVALLAISEEPVGRVLQLRSRLPMLREVYRRRGDRRRRWWESVSSPPFSHELDEQSGLPLELEQDLRIRTARKGGMMARQFLEPELDDATRAAWEDERALLVTNLTANGVVGMLSCDRLDGPLVDKLVDRYPLVFVVATDQDMASEIREHAAFQELAPGIDDERAKKALYTYSAALAELGGEF